MRRPSGNYNCEVFVAEHKAASRTVRPELRMLPLLPPADS